MPVWLRKRLPRILSRSAHTFICTRNEVRVETRLHCYDANVIIQVMLLNVEERGSMQILEEL